MSEVTAGFKFAGKALDLFSRIFGPAITTRRQAKSDAEARVSEALAKQLITIIETTPMSPGIMDIIISCGGKLSVKNLAKIVQKAGSQLTNDAMPSRITEDWAANFRDKARNCSDEEMADLWAQLLAGEANNPGSVSRKTVNILADMDKSDAELFSTLCRFRLITFNFSNVRLSGSPTPPRSRFNTAPAPPLLVVFDAEHPIYRDLSIDTAALFHLEGLGLIRVEPQGYDIGPGKIAYVCESRFLVLSSATPIGIGTAYFTTAGSQMSELCFPLESPEGFADYLTEIWQSKGITISNDLNEIMKGEVKAYDIDPETGEYVDQHTGERIPKDRLNENGRIP